MQLLSLGFFSVPNDFVWLLLPYAQNFPETEMEES